MDELTKPDRDDRRLTLHVVVWVVAAVSCATVATLLPSGVGPDPRPALAGWLGLAAVALGVIHVRVPLRGTIEATTLTEAALLPIMVLLPPDLAVATAAGAALLSEAYLTRGNLMKMAFNVAWVTTGVAIGSGTYHLLVAEPFTARPAPLTGALLAAALLVGVNLTAFAGVVATRSGSRWVRALAAELSSAALLYGTGVTGVLLATLVVHAPLALPLLVVPVLLQTSLVRARSESHEQIAVERSRFERTVQGATDGVALLDADARIVVWNPRMADLTGVPEPAATGRTLADIDCGVLDERTSDGEPRRVPLGDRVVDVSTAAVELPANSRSERVISVRDVSREAELAQIRDDLVTRISHEIRTPLTTLSGFLETLRMRWESLDEPQRRELVLAAQRGAHRLTSLVANLMVWSRIESRDEATHGGSTGLRETLLAVFEDLGAAAPDDVRVARGLRVAMTPLDLRHVVSQLLENASTYGRRPVIVSATELGGHVELSVTDAGAGLPEEAVAALYEPFAQHSRGLTRTSKGLGMGLAIVRALVTRVGGEIRYERPAGGGARFVVSLPRATPDP